MIRERAHRPRHGPAAARRPRRRARAPAFRAARPAASPTSSAPTHTRAGRAASGLLRGNVYLVDGSGRPRIARFGAGDPPANVRDPRGAGSCSIARGRASTGGSGAPPGARSGGGGGPQIPPPVGRWQERARSRAARPLRRRAREPAAGAPRVTWARDRELAPGRRHNRRPIRGGSTLEKDLERMRGSAAKLAARLTPALDGRQERPARSQLEALGRTRRNAAPLARREELAARAGGRPAESSRLGSCRSSSQSLARELERVEQRVVQARHRGWPRASAAPPRPGDPGRATRLQGGGAGRGARRSERAARGRCAARASAPPRAGAPPPTRRSSSSTRKIRLEEQQRQQASGGCASAAKRGSRPRSSHSRSRCVRPRARARGAARAARGRTSLGRARRAP